MESVRGASAAGMTARDRRHRQPSFVYGLFDPRDGLIRYIGLSGNPDRRIRDHRTNPLTKEMGEWLSEMFADGIACSWRCLEKSPHMVAGYEAEKWWIKSYSFVFPGQLFNRNDIAQFIPRGQVEHCALLVRRAAVLAIRRAKFARTNFPPTPNPSPS